MDECDNGEFRLERVNTSWLRTDQGLVQDARSSDLSQTDTCALYMSPWTGRVSDSLSNKKHCPQAADLSAENSHSLIKTMASYFPSDHWNPASKTKSALFRHAKPYKNKMYNLTNNALSMISIIYRSNNQSYVNSCDIVLVHKDVNRLNDPTFQNRLTRSHYTPEARVQLPSPTCVTFDIPAFPLGKLCTLW